MTDSMYLDGVLISFVINALRVFFGIHIMNTTRSRNLRRVGYYINPFSGRAEDSKPMLWVIVPGNLLITPLLSWLNVAASAFALLYSRVTSLDHITPDSIKQIEYKLSTQDLHQEQILQLLHQKMIASGVSEEAADKMIGGILENLDAA